MEIFHTEEKIYSTNDFADENDELITIYPEWFKLLPNYLIVGKVVAYLQVISRDIRDFIEIGLTRRYMKKYTFEYSSKSVCKLRNLIEAACHYDKSVIPENELKICQSAIDVIMEWEKERGNEGKYGSYNEEDYDFPSESEEN